MTSFQGYLAVAFCPLFWVTAVVYSTEVICFYRKFYVMATQGCTGSIG